MIMYLVLYLLEVTFFGQMSLSSSDPSEQSLVPSQTLSLSTHWSLEAQANLPALWQTHSWNSSEPPSGQSGLPSQYRLELMHVFRSRR